MFTSVHRNMNQIAQFVITALVLKTVCAQQSSNVSIIEKILYQRCRAYSSDAAVFDEIKVHWSAFTDYLQYTSSLLPNGQEQFCRDERPKLIGLSKNLAIEAGSCMSSEEKYLPGFIYNSFAQFLNFACKEGNIKNFFSGFGNECRTTLKANQAGEEVGVCFKKLFAGFNGVIPKDDLCLDLKLAKTCFGTVLEKYCTDFRGYRTLNADFFDAIMSPCSKKSSAIMFGSSTVILILSVLFTKCLQ